MHICTTSKADPQRAGAHAEPCVCGSPIIEVLHLRAVAEMSRRAFLGGTAAVLAPFVGLRARGVLADQPAAPERPILFTNVTIFDGTGGPLVEGRSILVDGDRIAALPGAGEHVADAQIVDCGGRLAMPGLIDAHWHATLCAIPMATAMTADIAYIHLVAAAEAERTLMRGFTTVRDAGGPVFALKRAIDEGIVNGPRIYPAGAMISQTSGHGDFRMRHELPRSDAMPLSHAERHGVTMIADGEAEVLRRVREQLMLGASQIKLMAGGGVSSLYDPLDTLQYSERELRTAVDAAADWVTYVMAHVYTAPGIRRAVGAGVQCIEHGQLADEEAVRVMAEEGVWWSLQPFLADADANIRTDPDSQAKQREVAEGTVRAYEMAKRFGVRTGWGTDILFTPQVLPRQGAMLAKLTRFYDPLELLGIATGGNGELLRLSGPRNPYAGELGRIATGALADILIADGDPRTGLDFLTEPEANLRIIMKDGRIYKDSRA